MSDSSDKRKHNLKKSYLAAGMPSDQHRQPVLETRSTASQFFGHPPNVSWMPLRNKNTLSNSGMQHHVLSRRMNVLYAWESRYLQPQVVWNSKPTCKSHKVYTLGSYTQPLSYLLRVTKNVGAPKEVVYIS
jgi:hypothetical protein